jgi:hypothetical protein
MSHEGPLLLVLRHVTIRKHSAKPLKNGPPRRLLSVRTMTVWRGGVATDGDARLDLQFLDELLPAHCRHVAVPPHSASFCGERKSWHFHAVPVRGVHQRTWHIFTPRTISQIRLTPERAGFACGRRVSPR